MNFFQAVGTCFSKYATFTGRARRAEYWWFALFSALVNFVLILIESESSVVLSGLYQLAVLLPTIAVTTRRLHDIGRSGWWQLIILLPLVGVILLLVWLVRRGDSGSNSYGMDPLRDQPDGSRIPNEA